MRFSQSAEQLQLQLQALGFDPKHIDGLRGNLTNAALRGFFDSNPTLKPDGLDDIASLSNEDAIALVKPLLIERTRELAARDDLSRDEGRALQRNLYALGFNPGPIDGIVGSRTMAAAESFQLAHAAPASPAPPAPDARAGAEAPATAVPPAAPMDTPTPAADFHPESSQFTTTYIRLPSDIERPTSPVQPEPPAVTTSTDWKQYMLTRLGHNPGAIDGRNGRQTQTALRAFQDANGLAATGQLDATTELALRQAYEALPQIQRAELETITQGGVLRFGRQGESVQQWQEFLVEHNYLSNEGLAADDGFFVNHTDAATRAWQRDMGLNDDGVVGPLTLGRALAELDKPMGERSIASTPAGFRDLKPYQGPPLLPHGMPLTQKDKEWLARIAYDEALIDGPLGMQAVIENVICRVNSPDFPNTIEGVITQRNGRFAQYSPYNDGHITAYNRIPAHQREQLMTIIENVTQGTYPQIAACSLYFLNPDITRDHHIEWHRSQNPDFNRNNPIDSEPMAVVGRHEFNDPLSSDPPDELRATARANSEYMRTLYNQHLRAQDAGVASVLGEEVTATQIAARHTPSLDLMAEAEPEKPERIKPQTVSEADLGDLPRPKTPVSKGEVAHQART